MPKIKIAGSKKTVNLPKYCRILHYWKPDPYAEAAQGRTTNEFKTDLIKSGYDIFCPSCDKHFNLATFTQRVQCPSCKFKWIVSINCRPKVGGAILPEPASPRE